MLLVTMLTTLLFGNNVRADYYDDFYDNEYDYEYSDADDLEIDYKSLSLNEGSTQKIEYVFRPASMDGTNSPGESSPAERYKSVFLLPQ